jgi:hypothetical protein
MKQKKTELLKDNNLIEYLYEMAKSRLTLEDKKLLREIIDNA